MGGNEILRACSLKFLGIFIDEKLSFKEHINHISEKAGKCVGLLYRLSKFLPPHILKTLYHCLVAPHISYGIEAWYAAPQTISNRISVLQKKTVRAVNHLPYNSHTNDYFASMNILKLEDIYNLQLGKLIFSNRANLTMNSDIHAHNTRARNNLSIPQYNLAHTQTSCKYRGINLWNNLPIDIKESASEKQFVARYKCHLLQQYSLP